MASFIMCRGLYLTLGFVLILSVQPGCSTFFGGDDNSISQEGFHDDAELNLTKSVGLGDKELTINKDVGFNKEIGGIGAPIGEVITFDHPPSTTAAPLRFTELLSTIAPPTTSRYIPPRFNYPPHPQAPRHGC